MKNYYQKLILISLLFFHILNAEEFNINNLLNKIERKTDLSEKTKLANSGINTIYTREDIQRLQIHNLKDILKSTYPIGYKENHFGIPDPYNSGTPIPFVSSNIRIYIDNQEITSGYLGSGLAIYGNMDIDFVDHIEVYNSNPTYQFSTEPTVLLIKLYSKSALKDEGSKVSISTGSNGTKNITFYNSQELKSWSYFAYGSFIDKKRPKIISKTTELSRDQKDSHIFASIYNQNHRIVIDSIGQSGDGFIGPSIDATPIKNELNNNLLHIGYDATLNNFLFSTTYDHSKVSTDFEDDMSLIPTVISTLKTDITSDTYTSGLKYKKSFLHNELILGINYRIKNYNTKNFILNTKNYPEENSYQKIISTFIENQYSIKANSILTTGFNYSKIKNKNSIQEDELYLYRLGYTFTNNNYTSKTIYSHTETSLEPYLVGSELYLSDPTKEYKKTKQNILMENLIYEKGNFKNELLISYLSTKNRMFPDSTKNGLLNNYNKNITIKSIFNKTTNTYNNYDLIEFTLYFSKFDNLPNINTMKQYSSMLKNINTFNKFDIFNEIIYERDDHDKKDFFNYSAGIVYHYTKDLTISLKGTNLFNKAKQTEYIIYKQIATAPYLVQDTPIKASPIDKEIILRLDYTF